MIQKPILNSYSYVTCYTYTHLFRLQPIMSITKSPIHSLRTARAMFAWRPYLAIRQKLSSRNAINQTRNANVTRNYSIQNLNTSQIQLHIPSASSTLSLSYAESVKQIQKKIQKKIQVQNPINNNNDLFSMSELLNIYNGAVMQLSQCKSKIE